MLSENWIMTGPRDLRALVRIAAEAEQAGKSLRTYVNGRLAQDGSTDEMAWDMHY
jgi:2-keto-4-pentenoate hydratase/2-oxohepta-3-ene-1,7-dioic acid hydratase in catechol pathway